MSLIWHQVYQSLLVVALPIMYIHFTYAPEIVRWNGDGMHVFPMHHANGS